MKLEKKHYYWIGGIIIALILIYYFWGNISSLWSTPKTTRMFREGGMVSGTAGLGQGSSTVSGRGVTNVGYMGYTYPYAQTKWSCIDRADGVNCTKCQSSDGMIATGGACGNL